MNDKNGNSVEQWLHKLLVPLWMAVIVGYVINAVVIIFWPKVESVIPDVPINASLGGSSVAAQQAGLQGRTFVNRPLFLPGRRSPADLDSNVALVTDAEGAGAGAFEGIKLVGLFASESELGVILLDEVRSSVRLDRGQSFKGWTLVEVDADSAFFASASGGRIKLGLTVPQGSQKASVAAAVKRENGSADANLRASVSPADNPPKNQGASPLTLESMYEQKAAARRSLRDTEDSQK